MEFDKIIINPPFRNGSMILHQIFTNLSSEGKIVVICPMANLIKHNTYRNVQEFTTIESLFDSADITKSLGISIMTHTVKDIKYAEFEMNNFDKQLKQFYQWNWNNAYLFVKETKYLKPTDFNFDTDFIESCRLPSECQAPKANGYTIGNNIGYRVNLKKERPNTIPNHLCVIHFPSSKAKDNFSLWAYSSKTKDNLANKAIFGLKKQSVSKICACAIPQINWEEISNNDLWKQGKLDEAVLSVMKEKN